MRRPAFTLLELVVVIAIILILLSLFVPALYHFIKFVRHLGE